ncbi:MAG TPA: sulfatase [Thermomicrobiales bacterium]|nr:sulfatase [Thermomicrobiales bacterium]
MSPQPMPNILFIMSDDHAAHAIGAYGSQINETPHIDRIASEGVRLDTCLCTNSICAPSRAAILTGTHSHINGVRTLADDLDGRQETFPQLLQQAGYQTAIFGKWHLGHGGHADPTGFDRWAVLPGQGLYHNPAFFVMGERVQLEGYVTDLITDYGLDWLRSRDRERPFMLMLHHKAPHRPWEPDEKHAGLYEESDVPLPATFKDDYENRSNAAKNAKMRIESHLYHYDLKYDVPEGLSPYKEKVWKYQRYIKDYLRCVASVDENVGRVLDYLDEESIAEDTIVIYTSDQGFFLGDHGWYDKRFMYEESLRMPFVMRYPHEMPAGTVSDAVVTNVDFAPLLLDYAGLETTDRMQGRSFRRIATGDDPPSDWPEAMYYRYWMHLADHHVPAHYGIRSRQHKLIYYYGEALGTLGSIDEPTEPEWELFDLEADPREMRNVYSDPACAHVVSKLSVWMHRLQREAGDAPVSEV